MKLKKMLALLLALMMALALVACGDTADTGNESTPVLETKSITSSGFV